MDGFSGEFSETWPTSVSMRNMTCFQRRKRAPRIAASGGSVWPTPDCNHSTYAGTGYGPNLRQVAELQWQTSGTDSFRSRGGDRKDEMGLDQQARFWATPTTQDGKNTAGPSQYDRNSLPLNVQSVMWSTPQAHDTRGWNPTTDYQHLPNAAIGFTHPPATTTPDGPSSSPNGQTSPRRLNCRFAEMLMGWPPGWTNPCSPLEINALEPLGMEFVHLQPPSRGLSSGAGWRGNT